MFQALATLELQLSRRLALGLLVATPVKLTVPAISNDLCSADPVTADINMAAPPGVWMN